MPRAVEVDRAGGAPAPSRCTCQAWLGGPESHGRWLLRLRRRAAAAAQLPVALVGCDAVRLTVSDLEEVTRRMLAAVYCTRGTSRYLATLSDSATNVL